MIGETVPRIESEDKVTGSLAYLEDIQVTGMLHGKILRSSYPHARIRSMDVSQARQLSGVAAVLTRDDIRGNPRYHSHFGPVLKDQPILAIEKVRYVGDPVAAVAATDSEIAEAALDLIRVDYEELPAVFDCEQALAEEAPLLHEEIEVPKQGYVDLQGIHRHEGTNLCSHFDLKKGDVERGFAESDRVFEDVFTSPATHTSPMESLTAVARFDSAGKLTLWSTTQNPFAIRDQVAELFRLPVSMVRVISLHLGGGFGSKVYPKLEPLVAALAYKAGQPVGITLTREEVFQTITKHPAKVHLKTGVKKDGTVLAQECRIYLNTGAYAEIGPRVCQKGGYTAAGPYETSHVHIDSRLTYTNTVPAGAFRGFGVQQTSWAHESQMDMIARALKMDPLELRLKNLLEEGSEFVTGERVHGVAVGECLKKVAEAIGWGKRSASGDTNKARGKGLACMIKATITPSISSALVRLNEDGSVHLCVGTVDMGQGSDTVLAQIASQELAMPMDQIDVMHSDTDTTPYDQTTSSSRSTFQMGRAVQLAAQDLKRQLACIAGPGVFKVSPEEVLFEDQKVKAGDSEAIGYGELLLRHFGIKGVNLVGSQTVLTSSVNEQGEKQTSAFWFVGAGAVEVEVDCKTGHVRVVRYAASADVGKAVNPLACRQQLRGAAIMGIGQALLEEMVYQEGLLINPNLLDYNLPRFLDLPEEIITILVERPHRDGPHGAKGLGETGVMPVAPAIANAVQDAVGVRIRELPITPEKVLESLQQKSG